MGAAVGRGRPLHLIRRGDTFHFRMRVPRDLVDRVGVIEGRRSLGIARLAEARLLAPMFALRLKDAFKMIRAEDLTAHQVAALVTDCFRDLSREADVIYRPISDLPLVEIEEQRELSEHRLGDLVAQINERRTASAQATAAPL